jgi:hypothetical protein
MKTIIYLSNDVQNKIPNEITFLILEDQSKFQILDFQEKALKQNLLKYSFVVFRFFKEH